MTFHIIFVLFVDLGYKITHYIFLFSNFTVTFVVVASLVEIVLVLFV